jgi:hypothetical protein
VTLPLEFGPSWDAFVAEWCLGTPPVLSEIEVVGALETLKCLIPERFRDLISGPGRGLAFVLPAIDLGRILQACEKMPGFHKILARLQRHDRSAFSEAQFAEALSRIGCKLELEPRLGGAVPDTAIDWHGVRIYAEVISPEHADAIVSAHSDVRDLANAIKDIVPGCVVEVLLETDINPEVSAAVLRAVNALSGDQPTRIEGLATLVRRPASIPLQVGPTLNYTGLGPVVGTAAGLIEGRVDGVVGAAGIVRMPVLDSRVRRLLAAELHHFSKDSYNVLAIDITAVTASPKDWAPLIQRSFQPAQNRRIGAVIFFSSGMAGTPLATRQRWAVVPNKYAYRTIPADLLAGIAALDEDIYYRGTTPEPAV